jgi:hypothetical protein
LSTAKESERAAETDVEAELDVAGVTLDPCAASLAPVADDMGAPHAESTQMDEIAATKAAILL